MDMEEDFPLTKAKAKVEDSPTAKAKEKEKAKAGLRAMGVGDPASVEAEVTTAAKAAITSLNSSINIR
jgi:hypothetical protein